MTKYIIVDTARNNKPAATSFKPFASLKLITQLAKELNSDYGATDRYLISEIEEKTS